MAISLTCIDTMNYAKSTFAIQKTLETIPQITKIYWISDIDLPLAVKIPVEKVKIGPIRHNHIQQDYNNATLKLVPEVVKEEHNIIVQWDGFAVNGDAWTDKFLEYDYIGAVWPWHQPHENVGNGGFSLRSRKLYDAILELKLYNHIGQEDDILARFNRPVLQERFGIKYAHSELADQFSIERNDRSPWVGKSLGFHGIHGIAEKYGITL
jgi:Protein of unknown function (DUF5672)